MGAEGELRELTLYEHRERAGAIVDRAMQGALNRWAVADAPEVRSLAAAPPDLQRSIVIVLLDRISSGRVIPDWALGDHMPMEQVISTATPWAGQSAGRMEYARVLGTFGSRRPPFTRGDVRLLLELATHALRRDDGPYAWLLVALAGQPVGAAERAVKQGGLGELEAPVRGLAKALDIAREHDSARAVKYRARLIALLQPPAPEGGSPVVVVDPTLVSYDDDWGRAWRTRIPHMTPGQAALFVHCSLAAGVTPSVGWRGRAAELARPPDAADMLHAMLSDTMLAAANQTYQLIAYYTEHPSVIWDPALADANVVLVRGAMWAAASLDSPWVTGLLFDIGVHFGTSGNASNVIRDERLANTAIAALGSRPDTQAITALGRLKAKVTQRNVSKQLVKALDAAATAAGISQSELLEMAVPTQGLDAAGGREVSVADHVAIIGIDGDDVSLMWRAPDGSVTARVPAALEADRVAVASAKDEAKDLRKALGIERGRVEDLFTEDREWDVATWRARYLDHPLTGTIGRRLIWTIVRGAEPGSATAVLPDGDGAADASGAPVSIGSDDRVRLWHPIDATEADIAAWRSRLLDRRLRQPFKQAFREVYVLTPAEEETATYSNRFAGHILAYPQARALMTVRRWASNYLGPFDGGYNGIARREFRTQGIRAEFWHDALEAELQGYRGAEHCRTDQVRFVRQGRDEELLDLRDVPPIVFSEAMRDVDLFVSVTSVGADRNWQDGGRDHDPRFDGYWGATWDAPLTATAAVRQDVLARIIPGLAIADRLELADRWLLVRGDLRTYKIHLVSGNILMSPSDRYLCIVPARGGAAERLFLPFDDDPTLSVILSKAYVLARDTKITDRSIVRQIRAD